MGSYSDVKSVDDALSLDAKVFSIYTQRQDQILGASLERAQLKTIATVQSVSTQPKGTSITLILERTDQNPPTVPAKISSPGTAGKPTSQQSQGAQKSIIAKITLDVAPSSDGFAQSVGYVRTARQSEHQTAGGFTIDEWGMAPGDIKIAAKVVFTRDTFTQIKTFKDQLDQAKAVSPLANLSPDSAKLLRYHNSIDGQSYIITQTSLTIDEVAGEPNQALVAIIGRVLYDYSRPFRAATKPQGLLNQLSGDEQKVLQAFNDLGKSVDTIITTAGSVKNLGGLLP
jgi:hypothetical protein